MELNSIDPVSKFINPERHLRKVVFPEPLFPTIAQISPNFKEKLTSFNDPAYSELVLFKKGIIYRDIGMRDKAQKVFQTLLNFYPDSQYKAYAEQEIHNI